MVVPDTTTTELVNRLKRVEGQVRGLQDMLLDGRPCRDVITQLRAARHALDQVGFRLLSADLQYCLSDPEGAARGGESVEEVERLFLKLA